MSLLRQGWERFMDEFKLRSTTSEPWNVIAECLDAMDGGAGHFKRVQMTGARLFGFVVAGWGQDSGELAVYYRDSVTVSEFGDATEGEAPYIFQTLKTALVRVQKMRATSGDQFALFPSCHWGICLWQHPEHYDLPIETHLLRDGRCFEGSPTQ